MDIKFKVEITLDKDKIIDEQKYLVKTIEEVIRKVFTDKGIEDKSNDNMLIFCTDDHNMFAIMWVAIMKIDSSNVKPYIKSFTWYNNETQGIEDILKESAEYEREQKQA